MCAQQLYAGQDNWFPFVACLEKHPHKGEKRVDTCAGLTGYRTKDLLGCATGASVTKSICMALTN